jgi:regulator of protease activity HflC (stomatin/prohibitin superfamily)
MSGLIVFFTTIFFTTSYFRVEQDEYAVVTNNISMQFNDKILTQGSYILTPFSYLIIFKRTLQNIELGELQCMSADSVMLKIHVAIQYKLSRESLIPIILKQFDNNDVYVDFLHALLRSAVLNSCLDFSAIEYYEERTKVDLTMFNNLILEINDINIGASVEYFQLVDITYPPEYQTSLHDKQNIKQELITAENNRKTDIINANTFLKESKINAQINIINAYNVANITTYNAIVQYDIIINKWTTCSTYYLNIVQNLNLSTDDLLNYINADLKQSSNKLYQSI